MSALIEFRRVKKAFGSNLAISDLNFQVEANTIHGIVGENGAGKSTAMKLLYGMHSCDSGQILLRGEDCKFKSAQDAVSRGIGMVHQHFMLAEPFSALDNLLLYQKEFTKSKFGWFKYLNRKSWLPKFLKFDNKFEYTQTIENISVGEQQKIEILKILTQGAEIIILDEPTAVLTPQETLVFFDDLRRLRNEGKTILIITHKLSEIMNVASAVTIFRRGEVVKSALIKDCTEEDMARWMIGDQNFSNVFKTDRVEQNSVGKSVLKMSKWSAQSSIHSDFQCLKNISLEVKAGEIVGVAGVNGNGQELLIESLLSPSSFRRQNNNSAEIEILGKSILNLTTQEIRSLGVGALPEDRLRLGIIPSLPLYENFLLGQKLGPEASRKFGISYPLVKKNCAEMMKAYDVRPLDIELAIEDLSGGNQQKFVVGRELFSNPKFLVAAQPTRGVDILAKSQIHARLMGAARDQNAAILLISSSLDELFELSDRILVIYKGEFIAEFVANKNFSTSGIHNTDDKKALVTSGRFDEIQIGLAMAGRRSEANNSGANSSESKKLEGVSQ